LAIQHKLNVQLGDVIYYVNNGTKASQGDVQKVNKLKNGWRKDDIEYYTSVHGNEPSNDMDSMVRINCYMLNQNEIENNPDMKGDYNVPRAIVTFNKRIEPLLVVFKEEVRENLLVTDPEERGFFTKEQCELINGVPFKEGDQDRLQEDVLDISEGELKYWVKRGIDPNYIYDLASEGWEEHII
jgi:hypothetical protein